MKRKLLMTLCGVLSGFAWAFADDVNYTGTVVSKTGEPIMGATVTVTGTTVSTMTDMDGKFSLIVPDGYTTVTVTYSGMKKQTVNVQREPVVLYATPQQAIESQPARPMTTYKPVKPQKPYKKNVFNMEFSVGSAGGDWGDMTDEIEHASFNMGWRHNLIEYVGVHVFDAGFMALDPWPVSDVTGDDLIYTLSSGIHFNTPSWHGLSLFASMNFGAAYCQGDDEFYVLLRPRVGINLGRCFYIAYRYDHIDRSEEEYEIPYTYRSGRYYYTGYETVELPSIEQHSLTIGFNF